MTWYLVKKQEQLHLYPYTVPKMFQINVVYPNEVIFDVTFTRFTLMSGVLLD
jgi:hypothetical protein